MMWTAPVCIIGFAIARFPELTQSPTYPPAPQTNPTALPHTAPYPPSPPSDRLAQANYASLATVGTT